MIRYVCGLNSILKDKFTQMYPKQPVSTTPLFPEAGQRPLNIVCFASGQGSNIRALLEAQRQQAAPAFRVRALFCDRQCQAMELAKDYQIPVLYLSFKRFMTGYHANSITWPLREKYDGEILHLLHSLHLPVDCIFLAGYMRLVSSVLLKEYPNRILNIHPADLCALNAQNERKYIGADSVTLALRAGEQATRSSMILVDQSVDGGTVLCSGPWVTYQGPSSRSPQAIKKHQELQKIQSDWPAALSSIQAFAAGELSINPSGQVYWKKKALDPEGIPISQSNTSTRKEACVASLA